MKGKEYWSTVHSKKEYLLHYTKRDIVITLIYIAVIFFVLYRAHDSILVLLVVGGGALWLIHGEITRARKMTSSPICRLTDEFIALDYDHRIVPWEKISRIVWCPTKGRTIVFYRDHPEAKYTLLSMILEKISHIDRKWMKDEDAFYEDLKAACDEHSIPFYVSDTDYFFDSQRETQSE